MSPPAHVGGITRVNTPEATMRFFLFPLSLTLTLGACRNEDTREHGDTGTTEPLYVPAGVDWTNADQDANGVSDMVEGHATFTTLSGADVVVVNPTQCDQGFMPGADYVARGELIDAESGEITYYWEGSGFGPTFQVDVTSDAFPDIMGVQLPKPGIWWMAFYSPSSGEWCDHATGVSAGKLETNIFIPTDPACGTEASMVDAVTEDHEWWSAVARIDCD